jgi:flagellar basal body-associated protein FliL
MSQSLARTDKQQTIKGQKVVQHIIIIIIIIIITFCILLATNFFSLWKFYRDLYLQEFASPDSSSQRLKSVKFCIQASKFDHIFVPIWFIELFICLFIHHWLF